MSLLLGTVFGLAATESGAEAVVQETRDMDDFQRVSIAIGGTVTLRRGDRTVISIEAWRDTLAAIETQVVDGELQIRMPSPPRPRGPIRMHIVYRALQALTLTGSAEVTTDDVSGKAFAAAIQGSSEVRMPGLRVQNLTIDVSGSGELDVAALEATSATITVSGSGNVTLAGVADDVDVRVIGSGNVRAQDLATVHAAARVSGSGDVYLQAEETLTAEISGSGDIRYRGTPAVKSHITGSGRLRAD